MQENFFDWVFRNRYVIPRVTSIVLLAISTAIFSAFYLEGKDWHFSMRVIETVGYMFHLSFALFIASLFAMLVNNIGIYFMWGIASFIYALFSILISYFFGIWVGWILIIVYLVYCVIYMLAKYRKDKKSQLATS